MKKVLSEDAQQRLIAYVSKPEFIDAPETMEAAIIVIKNGYYTTQEVMALWRASRKYELINKKDGFLCKIYSIG